MKKTGDIKGLMNAIADDNEYVRSSAAEALAGYPDPKVKEILSRVKFDDPVKRVRDTATRAHLMVVQAEREVRETE